MNDSRAITFNKNLENFCQVTPHCTSTSTIGRLDIILTYQNCLQWDFMYQSMDVVDGYQHKVYIY